ncbi:NAD(P)H-hydrate epimerase [Natronocella acetinitrilica]|uniref:Bifunctional NAD(P)H-hydrate repair enzyme n=1 Tax=Natronocella acetinitrilica TaxID=414046 RepID=A0AAE3KG96_9GAMM|nr:NAD(P)H-hydrate dehydratase [Natronocella acetinitrilica]MCP1675007.1 NAD(P)H-hydrate epimerase [Natronocella acetinitrilica]
MRSLPRPLFRPEQVARLDRYAIDVLGVPGMELMDRAGGFAYAALRATWPEMRSLVVLCGGGNNGGDGYVIAELARRDGFPVSVVAMVESSRLKGDAASAAQRYLGGGGHLRRLDETLPTAGAVVVDALLGTGLERPVARDWAKLIDAVTASGLPVLSVDIPSGLNGETGGVLGTAIRADLTTTFIGLKRGLFTGAGPSCTGDLLYSDLALPPTVVEQEVPAAWRTDYAAVRHRLRRRRRDGHKGLYGHVLVVGGDHGTGGAVIMAAGGALRAGAGLVSVVTRSAHVSPLLGACPEAMVLGTEDVPDALDRLLPRASVVALGPGLGTAAWGRTLLRACIDSGKPLVVDADALNLLADTPEALPQAILTPHPGEAGRLLGMSTEAVQNDRWHALGLLCQRYQATAILKGAGTLIGGGDRPPRVCTGGNPGMATGGTGDVLTGICAGLVAQGLTLAEAAELAVCLHAEAGDQAAEHGERGMVATDLLEPLRALVNPI